MQTFRKGIASGAFDVEALEDRRLFAAIATPLAAEPAAALIAKINFQPANAPTYTGYLVDSGSSFGNRGNGLSYGWSSSAQTFDRNSTRSPDQRFDTFARMNTGVTWSLAVPNGRYVVKLWCGDASNSSAGYRVEVEGEMVVDGNATSTNRWVSGVQTVDVIDGRLTLRNAVGETRNSVNFIEVYQTDLPTTVTIGPENSGGFTRSGPADFLLRPSGSVSNVAKVEFFNNGVKIGEDTAAPYGLYYKNADQGSYSITTRITTTGGSATTSSAVPLRVTDPIVAWWSIGASDTNIANRRVGWNIKATGWTGFVNTYVKPQIAWGARRILLHNPFGTLPDENMQFDQYLHAKDAGLSWLINDFVSAWKPIIASGVEVIAYIGTMEGDANFNTSSWQTRFWASVQPLLDAGMSIGMDAAAIQPATSKSYQGAQLLRGRGTRVYVEARPVASYTHWHSYDVISTDPQWDRTDPDRYADSTSWAASNSQLKGEIIRAVVQLPPGETWNDMSWLAPVTRDIFAQGNSVATTVGTFIGWLSRDELLG